MKKITTLFLLILFYGAFAQNEQKNELLNYSKDKFFIHNLDCKSSQISILYSMKMIDSLKSISKIDSSLYKDLLYELGYNNNLIGNNILSLYYYSTLYEIDKTYENIHIDLATEILGIGNPIKCIDFLQNSKSIDTLNLMFYELYGNAYFLMNDYKKAIQYYEYGINKTKEDSSITNYLILMKYISCNFIDFKNSQTKIDSKYRKWPYPIIQYFSKKITLEDLVNLIDKSKDEKEKRERLCETLYYIRLFNFSIGNGFIELKMLKECINTKIPGFVESQMAKLILERIKLD